MLRLEADKPLIFITSKSSQFNMLDLHMRIKNTAFPKTFTLQIRGKLLVIDQPKIMGILNITPDSFYDGGTLKSEADILHRIEDLLRAGADFIDIGGMSTRPGSTEISVAEELQRIIPVIEMTKKYFPESILSVDTYRSMVARRALEAGADMINDISAGSFDEQMFSTVAAFSVPYIMMHIQGTPQTMQQNPRYKEVTEEVVDYFIRKTAEARRAGIHDIIIDPGFGFGKTIEHNYTLLKNLSQFALLGMPVMVGLSRKSMIYRLLNMSPAEALNGTTVVNTLALLQGAHLLRVHDVKEAREVLKIVEFYKGI